MIWKELLECINKGFGGTCSSHSATQIDELPVFLEPAGTL